MSQLCVAYLRGGILKMYCAVSFIAYCRSRLRNFRKHTMVGLLCTAAIIALSHWSKTPGLRACLCVVCVRAYVPECLCVCCTRGRARAYTRSFYEHTAQRSIYNACSLSHARPHTPEPVRPRSTMLCTDDARCRSAMLANCAGAAHARGSRKHARASPVVSAVPWWRKLTPGPLF